MKKDVFIKGYYGFGDNIFMFPFIKEACKQYATVYLETSFPFLFETLPNIKFVKPEGGSTLKTCQLYIRSYPQSFWHSKKTITQLSFPYYLTQFKKGQTLIQSFNQAVSMKSPIDFNLPINPQWLKEAKNILNGLNIGKKKLCIIKPPSDRKDWKCPARIPKTEYFQYLIDNYKHEYYFVSIAKKEIETLYGDLIGIDKKFENGEISLTTIIGLASLADMIITYNCFLFPLGLSVNTKTFVINGGYTDPNMYIDNSKMNLENLAIITPMPCCQCIDRNHNCKKAIPIYRIKEKFEDLKSNKQEFTITKTKKNLLISRMRAYRCKKIADNPSISQNFNIYTVDHTSLNDYRKYPNTFVESYIFPSVGNICRPTVDNQKRRELYNYCKKILEKNCIDIVLNAQPLHPYNIAMIRACKDLGIKVINTETFCDDKWLFDYIGCQYTCPNEIFKFVNKIPISQNIPIDLPKTTRQPQPSSITKEQFFKKYKLNPNGQYIVFLGQLLWDMSIKKLVNPEIVDYIDYIHLVISSNPETTFIVKYHPIYIMGNHKKEMDFILKYSNVVIVNESLNTLFNIFDTFTSLFSTEFL